MKTSIPKNLLITILLIFPSIGYAELNPYPPGRYVISVSNGDSHEIVLVDSMTGKSWVLQYSSADKDHGYYFWRPIVFVNNEGTPSSNIPQ